MYSALTIGAVPLARGEIFVRDLRKQMADDVEARGLLVFRIDHEPGRLLVVGCVEHVILGPGVIGQCLRDSRSMG